jgi:imidazole glycerol-phosphate synthase subunit HisH
VNIGIIDYGAGNLRSVHNALLAIGHTPALVSTPDGLAGLSHLILPGVGSFGDCMNQLEQRGLTAPLRQWLAAGKPYLGICLGYQILFESSEESPGITGLAFLPGQVRRFPSAPGRKIPHMGWNAARPSHPNAGPWHGLGDEPYFYFVHSYFPVPENPEIIAARTDYDGTTFASAVASPTLLACQFHPEKSQETGLRLIRNFLTPLA